MAHYIKLSTLNPLTTPPLIAEPLPKAPSKTRRAWPTTMSSALANYEDGLEPINIGFDTKIARDTKPGATKGASTAERDFVMGIDEGQQEKMRKRGCEGGKKGMGTRRAARLDGSRKGPGKKL